MLPVANVFWGLQVCPYPIIPATWLVSAAVITADEYEFEVVLVE
jgi:hypothetical protein